MSPRRLKIPLPDDAHVHLRDGAGLAAVVAATACQFGRAIVMPNLAPPVRTVADALAYRARILAALPPGMRFDPRMTLYLTAATSPAEIAAAAAAGVVDAVKLYPAGATTHSAAGVADLGVVDDAIAAMAAARLPLLVHGEVTDADVDIFDREAVFLDKALGPLLERHPTLEVVLEHVTTAAGVAFVRAARAGVAATITPQHLLYDRNALLVGGLRPHLYCLPILKTRADRDALLEAATSGSPRFFLGTDSAPHAAHAKESACGCAGCYSAPVALQLYAEAFDRVGALDRLADFASRFAAEFYGWQPNGGHLTLVEADERVDEALPFGAGVVRPLRFGERVRWRVERHDEQAEG